MTLQHNDNHPFPPHPAYKDSGIEWLNKIPEEWNKIRLAFVGKFSKGRGIARKDLTKNGVPVILYGDIYTKYNIQTEKLIHSSSEDVVVNSEEIHAGDLLLTGSGETREDIGKCVVYTGKGRAYAGGDIIILRPSKLHSVFISYVLNSPQLKREKAKLAKGEIVVHIYSSQLRNIPIPCPPYPEQTTIANFLDHKTNQIDAAIAKHRQLIELLREHRAAIINEAVTKGLNPDAPMKDSGVEWIGEVPAHWEVKKLKYVSVVNPQKGSSNIRKEDTDLTSFLPMEKVSESGDVSYDIKKPINEVYSGFTYFEKNDVIVAKITPCFENGKGALLNKMDTLVGFGSTEFHVLRAKENFLNSFLFYITRSNAFMQSGEIFMTGAAGQKRVPTSFMEEYFIGLPKLEEQQQIVDFIETETTRIDREISLAQQEIELLEEYRQSLIAEAVTGKIDVRDYVLED